ncbi:GLPGLI family protein [Mesonia sediminis]|uniref:GLPGLI family protein n=1 Tax=Mesonia sediminis TaxID=1703946 RepID=A0ABW5SHN3_9FLAO
MKRTLITCAFLFSFLTSFTQTLKVEYKASIKDHESNKNNDNIRAQNYFRKTTKEIKDMLKQVPYILITDNKNYFFYYEEPLALGSISQTRINLMNSLVMNSNSIYVDFNKKNAYYLPTNFSLIRQVDISNIKWTITKSKKKILGFTCYKALGKIINQNEDYKRVYSIEAWFTPEIPYKGGATAYGNLPGLILHYKDKQASFSATSIDEGDFEIKKPEMKKNRIIKHSAYKEKMDRMTGEMFKKR